ncbi:MAG: glycosyltransferase family 2 protein [Lachnospiraceae bacterium]|nr:glycosyltransferase family 2 protein [Lachnospiraceae bacterium]MBR5994373.1 glycosyltransferase family 2 protein [Lachnospiraceae bacterium]
MAELISLVIPSYNEEENIENTVKTLKSILDGEDFDCEFIFVNDGSADKTFEKIAAESEKDERVKGISFSRNFGKEAAIFAGLQAAVGDACVVLDCDLQHPPTLIKEMVAKWREGFEVVEGVKSSRGRESIFHKMSAGLFYRIMSRLIKIDMRATSDYKLLDRKVVNVLLSLTERNTFFRALTFWVGFKSTKLEYDVEERKFGTTKWSFISLMKYAINNATSFSTLPLQIVTFLGVISIIGSVILGIQTLVKFFMGTAEAGFPTVILLELLIGGFIMLSLGIIGHYIARIYEEVKGRPKYIVREHTKNIKGNI